MRIVGGRWAGRTLVSPAGRVRPTAEALRVAWLTALGDELKGARILDLFAGTGALGLEALSRGAARCDFVENGPAALHSLKANVAALRVTDRTRIFDRDAIPFVERLKPAEGDDQTAKTAWPYDITLADPPYGSRKLDRIMQHWLKAPFSRILSFEHSPDHELPIRGRSIRIGDAAVTILRAPSR